MAKAKSVNKNKKSRSFSNWSKKMKIIAGLSSVFVISAIGAILLNQGRAAVLPNQTYSNYDWQSPVGGFGGIQHELTIENVQDGATYFWAHQFHIVGGDGGYIGLQSNGSRVNGTVGKTAVFSFFSAGIAGSPSENCKVEQAGFDGYNTSGTSCRIPYDWVLGHKYQMTVVKGAKVAQGTIWGGWVKDLVTGADTKIADITVPPAWQGIGNVTSQWTEYFGGLPDSCINFPISRVRFYKPRTYLPATSPTALTNNLQRSGSGVCTNSQVLDEGDSVVQQLGSTTNMPTTNKNPTAQSIPTQTEPAPEPGKSPAPAAPAPSK